MEYVDDVPMVDVTHCTVCYREPPHRRRLEARPSQGNAALPGGGPLYWTCPTCRASYGECPEGTEAGDHLPPRSWESRLLARIDDYAAATLGTVTGRSDGQRRVQSTLAQESRREVAATLAALEPARLQGSPLRARPVPVPTRPAPIAWESTTPVYLRYVTNERYERLSPIVRGFYRPYRCAACAGIAAGSAGGLVDQLADEFVAAYRSPSDYRPTPFETELIRDAIAGLFADRTFVAALSHAAVTGAL